MIRTAFDATAFYSGIYLKQISKDGEGNTQYEVFTGDEEGYSLNMLNVTLAKNEFEFDARYFSNVFSYEDSDLDFVKPLFSYMSNEYLYVSGCVSGGTYGKAIDFMMSLEDGVSENGSIEFITNWIAKIFGLNNKVGRIVGNPWVTITHSTPVFKGSIRYQSRF